MKLKLLNKMETQGVNFDENTGYYLISQKWSLSQEMYITFVRKGALAYCYNINWAGPMSKFEVERFRGEGKIVVHQSTIKKLLLKVSDDKCNGYALPNTEEVRKIIGLNDLNLSQAI